MQQCVIESTVVFLSAIEKKVSLIRNPPPPPLPAPIVMIAPVGRSNEDGCGNSGLRHWCGRKARIGVILLANDSHVIDTGRCSVL